MEPLFIWAKARYVFSNFSLNPPAEAGGYSFIRFLLETYSSPLESLPDLCWGEDEEIIGPEAGGYSWFVFNGFMLLLSFDSFKCSLSSGEGWGEDELIHSSQT